MTQLLCPAPAVKLPGLQVWHWVAPARKPKEPAGQATQVVRLAAPLRVL